MATYSGRPSIKRWVVALGVAGFVSGYVGPIILNPDANQGPLLALFITGPGGVLAGLLLGLLFQLLPIEDRRCRQALWAAASALTLATLYVCIPGPERIGYIIEADVDACAPARGAVDDAIRLWEKSIERITWAQPVPDWKERASRTINDDDGVVLTMHMSRRSAVYRQRAPWSRGRRTVAPWTPEEISARYYARGEGGSCTPYLAQAAGQYWPFSDSSGSPSRPSKEWPPVSEPAAFLGLEILGPVPPELQRLISTP
jgi:hypothetical protein